MRLSRSPARTAGTALAVLCLLLVACQAGGGGGDRAERAAPAGPPSTAPPERAAGDPWRQLAVEPRSEAVEAPAGQVEHDADQVAGEDDPVAAWLEELDDDGRIGQLLMLRVYGGGIDEADPRNEARYGVATPREVIETFRPGGILLFRTDAGQDTGNLRDPEQVREFTEDLREVSAELGPPVTVAIDQEGGTVDRIGHFGTPSPTARELAENPDAAAEHADATIRDLAALGVDMNFAPVADVDSEATNPIIGDRAYSDDPEVVAEMVLAQLERYADRPVVAGLKHFPGHGDTTQDSHVTLPLVDADLDLLAARELVPFVAAIDAGAKAIMTAHLELPAVSGPGVPSSMSPAVVTDLLRDRLGFEGLVVTDSLEMAGARVDRPDDRVALHALLAGHDLLVLPPVPAESKTILEQALATDQLSTDQVEDSVERLLRVKADLQVDADERPDPEVVGASPPIG